MLCEWLGSLRAFPETRDAPVGIIDAGLTPAQIEHLKPLVTSIRPGLWPLPELEKKAGGKQFLQACVSRPFIPDLFPGHETYVWMDADTWLQTPEAVDLLLRGAQRKGLAVVPQTDRAYGKAMRLGWLGPFPFRPRSFYYSNARKAFDGKTARALFPYPALNAGVFALAGNAPHWARWQILIKKALKKGKIFTAEQLTLGMLVYLEGFEAEFLPAWCNWLCEHAPLWDEDRHLFVEPYLPHHPLSVIHLCGLDDVRRDRAILSPFQTVQGKQVTRSYRYLDQKTIGCP
ncbi:MAG: glycosyl transferase family 8 [Alphaproteobacteria bacterium]|nr:glycosyl transferase family 8 [Alphaproteobacteria bacterium]